MVQHRNKRKTDYLGTAGKALTIALGVKKLLNVEYKKHTITQQSDSVSSTTDSLGHLTAVPQDASGSSRNGISIKLTNLSIKGAIEQNVLTARSIVRFVVVQDMQQVSDSAPTWGNIFENVGMQDYLNLNTLGRFKILMDQTFTVNAENPTKMFKKNFKLNTHVRYNGSASTDIQKNGIYVLARSADAANLPVVNWNARITFVDN